MGQSVRASLFSETHFRSPANFFVRRCGRLRFASAGGHDELKPPLPALLPAINIESLAVKDKHMFQTTSARPRRSTRLGVETLEARDLQSSLSAPINPVPMPVWHPS